MADIVTGTTTGFVNNTADATLQNITDLRRETALDTAAVTDAVKDANFDSSIRNEQSFDRIQGAMGLNDSKTADRFYALAGDTADLRAQVTSIGYQVRDGFFSASKDSEINALKTQVDAAKNMTYLSDKIGDDGEKTRALIQSLNGNDLNRRLLERSAELTELRGDNRHWRHTADMGQWQNLNSQLQAFQSQLTETRQMATQGTVNFGSMSGNAGRNTSTNNVV